MKYYKIIMEQTFIGVANSNNFLEQNPINHWLISADEITGQYVECNNTLYRDQWMKGIDKNNSPQFSHAIIEEINEEEYNIYAQAVQEHEEIIIPDPHNNITIIEPLNEDIPEVDFVRTSKINEMSRICNQTIENGFDTELQGEIHHFSLTVQDQLNLITLSSMAAQGQQQIPYHADGELCKFYTAAEINQIVSQATAFKTYHTTYYNALKAYINSLETIEEIGAITYGIELPEEFQTDVLKAIS